MSQVWAVAPSIRPGGGTLPQWKAKGYPIAVLRQGEPFRESTVTLQTDHYLGWAKSINTLVKWVIGFDKEADWLVVANDDTLPDPNHTPEEIANQCTDHFGVVPRVPSRDLVPDMSQSEWDTFGVMQPVGDYKLWPGSNILGFAGSPWLGREWCNRAFGGKGPVYEAFFHNFGDEHLQRCAEMLGVFWQRDDLIHQHNHAGRGGGSWKWEPWQIPLNTPESWTMDKALFKSLESGGFQEAHNLVP